MALLKRERDPEPPPISAIVKPEPEVAKTIPMEKAERSSPIPFLAQPIPVPESREKFRLALWQRVQEYHMQSGWQSDLGGPKATKMEKLLEAFYVEVFCEDVPRQLALRRWDYNVRMRGSIRQKDHVDWLRVVCINEWSRLHPGYEKKAPAFEPVPHDKMTQMFRFRPTPNDGHLEKYGIAQLVAYWKENMIDLGLDIFAIIEAPRTVYPFGLGKSTVMMQVEGAMARALDVPFDPRTDIAYQVDYPRVNRFLEDHTKRAVRGVDEIEDIWGRRNSMAKDQSEDMRRLSLKRKDSQVWVGCAANIFRLDKDIFEKKATHIIRIPDEGRISINRRWGRAIVYEKGYDNEEKDVWGNSDATPGLMEIRWVDLPAPPKTVYHACIEYTNKNVQEIIKRNRSPLDRLVFEEDPDWFRGTLEEWAKEGGDWNPPLGKEEAPDT